MSEEKLKGAVVWFVNMYPDLGQSVEQTLLMIKQVNKPLTDKIAKDGHYVCLFIPTVKEASRVEKIDYNAPFPRYMPRSADVYKAGLPDNEKKKPKQEGTPGFINLFINFHPEVEFEVQEVLAIIRTVNEESFKLIDEDNQYQIMIVPTTKEASRVEKIDFEMPFPRFSPKMTEKVKTVIASKILNDDGEDDGDYSEVADLDLEDEYEG